MPDKSWRVKRNILFQDKRTKRPEKVKSWFVRDPLYTNQLSTDKHARKTQMRNASSEIPKENS